MNRKSVRILSEYQESALKAFEYLRLKDQNSYTALLNHAKITIKRAKRTLPAGEYKILLICAKRTMEILSKCNALGLVNLKRRLSEYHLINTLEHLLQQENAIKARNERQISGRIAA